MGKKVAFIGDSLSAHHDTTGLSWPLLWAANMAGSGEPVSVFDLGVDGHTFYRANTATPYGGQTAIQRLAAIKPDVVFVMLGLNDTLMAVDGRTLAQVQSDATTFLTALRAALPSAVVVYAAEVAYDSTKFPTPGTALKNKGTIPMLMTKRSSGILSGLFSAEILEDSVGSATLTKFSNWKSLDATVRGHATVNGAFDMHLWRVVRLGATSTDSLHPSAPGNQLLAGYASKAARSVAALQAVWPRLNTANSEGYTDPDEVFSEALTSSGDGWTENEWDLYSAPNFVSKFSRIGTSLRPATWWAPSGGQVRLVLDSVTRDDNVPVYWEARGCRPNKAVEASVDWGAFSADGPVKTDARGDLTLITTVPNSGLSVGSHQLRFKCADESFGPFTLSVYAATAPHLELLLNSNAPIYDTGAFSTLTYTNVKVNRGGGSYSGGAYTTPKAGRYAVTQQLTHLCSAANISVVAAVAVNGVVQLEGGYNTGPTAGYYEGATLAGTLLLNAGDSVQFGYFSNETSSSTYGFTPGTRYRATHASLTYIGP